MWLMYVQFAEVLCAFNLSTEVSHCFYLSFFLSIYR